MNQSDVFIFYELSDYGELYGVLFPIPLISIGVTIDILG